MAVNNATMTIEQVAAEFAAATQVRDTAKEAVDAAQRELTRRQNVLHEAESGWRKARKALLDAAGPE